MATLVEIVSDGSLTGGWTGRLTFRAWSTVAGVTTGVNLTGLTCTAQIRGKNQAGYVDTVGDVTLGNQVTTPGEWFLDPDPADFDCDVSPYSIRLKVVDGSSKTVYFGSNVVADEVAVGRP